MQINLNVHVYIRGESFPLHRLRRG